MANAVPSGCVTAPRLHANQEQIFVDPGEKDDLPQVFDGENQAGF